VQGLEPMRAGATRQGRCRNQVPEERAESSPFSPNPSTTWILRILGETSRGKANLVSALKFEVSRHLQDHLDGVTYRQASRLALGSRVADEVHAVVQSRLRGVFKAIHVDQHLQRGSRAQRPEHQLSDDDASL